MATIYEQPHDLPYDASTVTYKDECINKLLYVVSLHSVTTILRYSEAISLSFKGNHWGTAQLGTQSKPEGLAMLGRKSQEMR